MDLQGALIVIMPVIHEGKIHKVYSGVITVYGDAAPSPSKTTGDAAPSPSKMTGPPPRVWNRHVVRTFHESRLNTIEQRPSVL